jgi:hypothetical protein
MFSRGTQDAPRRLSVLPWLLFAVVAVGAAGGCGFGTGDAERRVEQARGIGETYLFTFSRPPSGALEWVSDHEVVFLTLGGRATVDVRTRTVTEVEDPSVTLHTWGQTFTAPLSSRTLPSGTRYGPWEVMSNGGRLKADESGDVTCSALLVSPDRKYVACGYSVFDRWTESRDGAPAVIRLR